MKSQTIVSGFDPNGPFGGLFLPPSFLKRIKETRFRQEWKLSLAQYAKMMGRKFPFYQRGTIGHFQSTIIPSSIPGGNVVLNLHFFSFFNVSGTHNNDVRFGVDGSLDEVEDLSLIDQPGEWWDGQPQAAIGFQYEVRALSAGKVGTWSTFAANDNTWITIDLSRTWGVTQDGEKLTSATFEIGPEGVESADDTGFIQCQVTQI